MDTILLTFANDQKNHLQTLQEEDDALAKLLAPRDHARHFRLWRDSYTTVDELADLIIKYQNDLVFFHFSGHAGRDRLKMGDGAAYGGGLAQLLGHCPKLKVVFLNGCSTQGMVEEILAGGVPIVVATSAPVDDSRASYFSVKFYEALCQQFSLQKAFSIAKAALEMKFSGTKPAIFRDAGFPENEHDEPSWGLFYKSENERWLKWRLPVAAVSEATTQTFQPNEHLLQTLFEALKNYSPEVKKYADEEDPPMQKVRVAVLEALPAPMSEPLRKLMANVEDADGYNKVGKARLMQISRAYTVCMELLGFTMFAQLWESWADKNGLEITPQQRETLRAFFKMDEFARQTFDFLPLIQTLIEVFDQNKIQYFIEELEAVEQFFKEDKAFGEAVHFLNSLRLQTLDDEDFDAARPDEGYLCKQGEECLATLFSRFGFLGKYRLSTVQGIDVLKFRHQRTPGFSHSLIILHDALGTFARQKRRLVEPMDNRAILLVNEQTMKYLNLSPFVIDENAFQDRTELCKIFMFSHYVGGSDDACFYRFVNKPGDPALEISAKKKTPLSLFKEQFDSFCELILQTKATAL